MSLTTTSWGVASKILADAGVPEDASYYRRFNGSRQKAILTVPMRIQAAWAVNDADAFADVFAENGSLLMQDNQLTSREEIRSYMAAGFRGPLKGARVKGWPTAVKVLNDRAAIVVTEGGILMPKDTELQKRNMIRAVWVVTKQPGGRLQLLAHHSCPIPG